MPSLCGPLPASCSTSRTQELVPPHFHGGATGVKCRNLTNDPKFGQLVGFPLLTWGLQVVAEDAGESRLDNVAGIAGKSQMGRRWPSVVSGQRSLAGSRRARLKANILLVLLLLLLLVLVPILPRRRLGFVSPALPEWREHRRAGRPRPP